MIPLPEGPPIPAPPDVFTGDGADGSISLSSGAHGVNDCLIVMSASGSSVTLAGSAAPGWYLFLQVQDAFATAADPAPLATLGSAGLWELAQLGPGEQPLAPLAHAYETVAGARAAQACRVPAFQDVRVTGSASIVPQHPWDGATGGVVAFFVHGTLTLGTNADVDASGSGFRGGVVSTNDGATNVFTDFTSSGGGGGKGESLDPRSFGTFGRASWANAGGGGNAHNSGGGGGSNGGFGGFGGQQGTTGGANPATQGRPGRCVLPPVTDRLVLGGGGGGGQQNGTKGTDGAPGGGIVLVFANTLVGGGLILSDGGRALNAGGDGAGGGGAGGTILLETRGAAFSGGVLARGGRGGDVSADLADKHGPGGGGSGGRIGTLGLTTDYAIVDVGGGAAGVIPADNETYLATPGDDGRWEH